MQLTVSKPCLAFAAGSRELRGRLPDDDRSCKHQRCTLLPLRMHVTGVSFAVLVANDRNVNGSPLNFVEAHAVGPPAFFCERIVPLRGHLESSHIADKRKNFHMALYPLPPSSNESVIDNGRNVWQLAMHIILVLPHNLPNNVV